MGAGHLTAARVLAAQLAERGHRAKVVDYLDLPADPRGRLTRGFYRQMVTRTPRLYDEIMCAWMRHPALFERLSAVGEGAYVRGLMRELDGFVPDVVLSTYNLAGQMLGRLRRRGLDVPVIAYVTDAGAHPYWVADGVDMHLAPLQTTADQLLALGVGRVQVVEPLVPPPAELGRQAARDQLGLAHEAPVAIVNGGSWGVGAVVEAAMNLGRATRPASTRQPDAGCRMSLIVSD